MKLWTLSAAGTHCILSPSVGDEFQRREQRLLHSQAVPGGPARLLDPHQQKHRLRPVRRLQEGGRAQEEPVHGGAQGPEDRHAAAGQEAQAHRLYLLPQHRSLHPHHHAALRQPRRQKPVRRWGGRSLSVAVNRSKKAFVTTVFHGVMFQFRIVQTAVSV